MRRRQREGEEDGGPPQRRRVSRDGGESSQNGGGQQRLMTEVPIKLRIPRRVLMQQVKQQLRAACNYLCRIRDRFRADELMWRAFIEILIMYQRGNMNSHEVYHEVALLFVNHNDLLLEFPYALPLVEIFTTNGVTRVHLAPDDASVSVEVSLQEILAEDDNAMTK